MAKELPVIDATTVRAKHKEFLFPCVTPYYEQSIVLTKGEGSRCWDSEGREYLDLFGGILTLGVGHCHPEVVSRIQQQIETLGHTSSLYDSAALFAMLGYIAFFALSAGPNTWVLLSEIYPNRIRGRAMAVATSAQWIANYAVSQTFPIMDKNTWLQEHFHKAFPYWIYGTFCFVAVVFVLKYVPETKGKSLEEIEHIWLKK